MTQYELLLRTIEIVFGTLVVVKAIHLIILSLLSHYQFLKLGVCGFYRCERSNSITNERVIEVIWIWPRFTSIKGKPIYIHHDHKYFLYASLSKNHPNVIFGTWRSRLDPKNYGNLSWRRSDNGILEGFWSGTKRDGTIEYGKWILTPLNRVHVREIKRKLTYNTYTHLREYFYKNVILPRRAKNSDLLKNILDKHNNDPCKYFRHNGRTYSIVRYVFNPGFGKIGRHIIDTIQRNNLLKACESILDWGTGCGYYAIEIAIGLKQRVENTKIYAIDSNSNAIWCAKKNIESHGMEKLIKLIETDKIWEVKESDKPVKFDLMVANLPFSRPEYTAKYKHNQMYSCFCAHPRLLFDLALGIRNQLKKEGNAIVCSGASGDERWFSTCLEIAGLRKNVLTIINKENGATDDIFYIYNITLK